jgi:hypothetical protein
MRARQALPSQSKVTMISPGSVKLSLAFETWCIHVFSQLFNYEKLPDESFILPDHEVVWPVCDHD